MNSLSLSLSLSLFCSSPSLTPVLVLRIYNGIIICPDPVKGYSNPRAIISGCCLRIRDAIPAACLPLLCVIDDKEWRDRGTSSQKGLTQWLDCSRTREKESAKSDYHCRQKFPSSNLEFLACFVVLPVNLLYHLILFLYFNFISYPNEQTVTKKKKNKKVHLISFARM